MEGIEWRLGTVVYKITDFTNADFWLVQRRPVVIASPTTGAETTDALTFSYLTLCVLIRTSIRVIRAECGEETHSASLSTH